MKASPGSCRGVLYVPQKDDGAHEPEQRLGRRLAGGQGWRASGLVLGLAAMLLLGHVDGLGAREPDLRVRKAPPGDVVVEIIPDAALPMPDAWNLYRGDLVDVPAYLQHGDPDGRCDVPGTDASIPLSGELAIGGNHYYLLTAVPPAAPETGLGTDSFGMARPNTFPCPAIGCGGEVLPTASILATEGIAIAPDGTIYYSKSPRAVGRRLPGAAPNNAWLSLPNASTVWGLALRADGMLFIGSPSNGGAIYQVDTTLPAPIAQTLFSGAGGANGVIVGPDEAVYYSDFNAGRLYRVDDLGARAEVTTSAIARANGLLFDDDGTLLVLAYSAGQVWRLTLDSTTMMEIARSLVTTVAGSLDGIAKDDTGRFYLGDNGNGRLLRYDAGWGNEEELLTGIGAAANIAFGKGALNCTDVYMASSGALGLFNGDATGRP